MSSGAMNAERLLDVYEQISEAPDAIARLRRFVLDLAVRGKLVEQDISEAPEQVGLEPYTSDAPYELPANWRWMCIGDQLDLLNGMAFKPTDWISEGLRIVRIQNLNNPDAPYNLCDPAMARDRSLIDNGSFLISWSGTPGTSFGAFIWDRGPAVLNQHIFRCDFQTDAYTPEFLKLAINGRLDEMIEKAHGGVGLRHITKGKLQAMLIAVPPQVEQHRIVAKVDELMALCDRLEEARKTREELRDKLTATSLARLTAPDTTAEDFPTNAAFALEALPALTTRPDQIKTLRQTILNLAVRGKLVEQDAADEPATELLEAIAVEQNELAKAGKIKRPKPLPPVDMALAPFDLPVGWSWTRFPELGTFGRGKSKHRPRNDPSLYRDGDIPFIQTGDVARSGGRITSNTGFYNEVGLAQSMLWPRGTMCITIAANIADSGILDFAACFPDSVVGLVPASMFDNARYFEYFIRTAKANLLEFAPATAQKNINLGILETVLIPLPPLAEQHRIVAKVDALMALCDRLEAALTTADTTRTRLLEALLHEALNPATDALEAAE
ncbi:restriction endonuclease subunit S [Pararhodobacter sp. CCB-MM2]|uniref:restriction endonuclease subunit S n=1 Tax=Pararhodobacter sp. CCB-MM2 TaxID=1786003 RepID=UPI00082ED3A0|nr:restriction endonuclease subunit S [Pararhodobacter sp. CCB-MM2]